MNDLPGGDIFPVEVGMTSMAPRFVLVSPCLLDWPLGFILGAPDGGCMQPGFPLFILKRLMENCVGTYPAHLGRCFIGREGDHWLQTTRSY